MIVNKSFSQTKKIKEMKTTKRYFTILGLASLILFSCDKKEQPGLGDYPADTNPPGGPLNFYVAFDGTTTNPLFNAVDSIRANFASDNPLASTDGISGKAIQGENKKFIKYTSFNDWATKAESFTVSVWFKKDGQTKNNAGGNGPEYIFSLRASKNSNNSDYHWSNAIGFVFLEGSNSACAVKTMFVSPSDPNNSDSDPTDNWFTWENSQTIAGLLDDNWHHMALTYDASTSSMTLYIDGVANPNVKTWGTGQDAHGGIRLSTTKINEYRVGNGPGTSYDSDDWLSSSFKGSMDQFRLYSKALTAAEVQTLFAGKQ